jgi:hypothetical protein
MIVNGQLKMSEAAVVYFMAYTSLYRKQEKKVMKNIEPG